MKLTKKLAAISLVLGLSACGTTYSPAANVVNLDNIDFSDVETLKVGKSCSTRILVFGPMGGHRLFDATKDGRIRKVKYVETSYSAFPLPLVPLIDRKCTIAYGE